MRTTPLVAARADLVHALLMMMCARRGVDSIRVQPKMREFSGG
jgi:hypothetical protein